ncbi:dolichyl-phosphate-mannose-protein mannosyltransferase [Bacteriovorax sp. BSW11_IV]|uniref:hypothetical protein n=1 Tax=Bacteriovorax sp. BSW11_IV TaxID=1353529 RepID=UPI000389F31E|nr:hypothetical protein [Bacteriovorax sp. BSW11_IV]EQC45738.1 dolichyl-phosphate-mannose-protein mannosyltransferase [Bacteriovorax sp. BSW11_IV]
MKIIELDKTQKKIILISSIILVIQGIWAIYGYGYIAQDWGWHSSKILAYKDTGFSYSNTNPPGFYVLGYLVESVVSTQYVFEAYAFLLLLINILAVFFFDILILKTIKNKALQNGLILLLSFVPFRVIHSIVISCDALTVLPFILSVFYVKDIISTQSTNNEKSKAWLITSFMVSIGLWFKYTFVGLLPPLGLLYIVNFFKDKKTIHNVLIPFIALLIPTSLFLNQMYLSYKAKSVTTHQHWDKRGGPADMNIIDITFPKFNDLKLLMAPDDSMSIRENHRFSYLGLIHYSLYFDAQTFFQRLAAKDWPKKFGSRNQNIREAGIDSLENPKRKRHKITKVLNPLALVLSLPISFISLFGLLAMFVTITKQLINEKKSDVTSSYISSALLLAIGFHSIILIPLPFVFNTYKAGYWTPRLIMPSILTYFIVGFYWLENDGKTMFLKFLPKVSGKFKSFEAFFEKKFSDKHITYYFLFLSFLYVSIL